MSMYIRSNQATTINPAPSDVTIKLTSHGSDWYWAAFSLLGVTALGFIVSSAFVPRKERIFHYFSIGATFFASIQYFTMASNLGSVGIQTEFDHYMGGGIRQVFYARYIGWFMVSPLILGNILLFSGVTWPTILFTLGAQEIYVVAALIGSLVSTSYKWGYFTFAVSAWFLVAYHLIFVAMPAAKALGSDVHKHYRIMLSAIMLIWTLYPIAWGLSEGGNVIAPDSEAAFYGVLDIITLPFIGCYFIYASRQISIERLGLSFGSGFQHSTEQQLPVREKHNPSEAPVTTDEETRHSGETAVNAETVATPEQAV
ncbi:uncharacterized protein V1518DRAFT_131773 [Limtongia smithiae]|uniref:uncharacterized protein n=1 Tax=Limtongia smithiae TaxID=1125753 RepID=UPI0034CF32D1